MERLIKRHEDFENTLAAQDERLKAFSDTADRLVAAKHYDADRSVLAVWWEKGWETGGVSWLGMSGCV